MANGVIYMGWQTSNVEDLDWQAINSALRERGFALIQHNQAERDTLLRLSYACGNLQMHERADKEGVVEVSSSGDNQKNLDTSVFRGLSAGLFPPHTDGAYLDTYYFENGSLKEVAPPKLIILQCVRKAERGGESILVDCQKILHDIHHNDRRLLDHVFRPAALFYRGSNKSVNAPIFSEVYKGKFWIRFRDDVKVKKSLERSMSKLFDEYISDRAYHVEFKLPDNAFAIIDNLRMLHMRRAFLPNDNGANRVLRRTWIYNDELDGDIEAVSSPQCEAFDDGTKYWRIIAPQSARKRLKVSLGIELLGD